MASETNLPSTHCVPPCTIIPAVDIRLHLREILFDYLRGGSHVVSSIQDYIYIMVHQLFKKMKGGVRRLRGIQGQH